MFAQRSASDIIENFLNNKECLKDFIDNLEIEKYKDDFEAPVIEEIRGELFEDNKLCVKSQAPNSLIVYDGYYHKNNNLHVDGFVVKYNHIEIMVINPESEGNYLKLWGHRNFFVYRLARWHSFANDGIVRYVINLSDKSLFKNSLSTFDKFDNFYILNLYEKNENLINWINALFK